VMFILDKLLSIIMIGSSCHIEWTVYGILC
jgi:hypothetical protein